jgi:hypothetical protein
VWGAPTVPRVALYYCTLSLEQEVEGAKFLVSQLVAHFTMTELLTAYAQLFQEYSEPSFRASLHRLMHQTSRPVPFTDTLIILSSLERDLALTLCTEWAGTLDQLVESDLFQTDELGLLTKELHDALLRRTYFSRSVYLSGRLSHRDLSDDQHALAQTLCGEWVGTLGDLDMTVRRLCPEHHQPTPTR